MTHVEVLFISRRVIGGELCNGTPEPRFPYAGSSSAQSSFVTTTFTASVSGVSSTFTLDITALSPMPNLYSNSFGGSARSTSPVTYRIGFPSLLGPDQVIAPPGFRSNSKSAPMKIF